ncbi:winged helix-turn-helix domain-containing protein [Thermomonospora umbrina]|uniref:IclR-like helix-turn-helix domain-containing protein n=1 Tax=Thermomonospora umbrina TaxID=111806 RepID=A0A3D9SYH6_9ACTN|nr:winged helix-turn-helix domain-containing protein [Thermomonospora umbrina]REF00628.1 IclR-like helix-turn-helix domain-containing protein [Thermomonospora umbrina]
MRIVERHMELEWGRRGLVYRAILRALGAAAQMSNSTAVEFGVRQLAYMAGVDHTTVARALQVLRTGPYALIDQVTEAQGVRADVYHLVVPAIIAAEAAWRSWRPGRLDAIHPAFRALGRPAAYAYEALSSHPLTPRDLATAALLPRSSAHDALRTLAAHGLAELDRNGRWRRGPADLDVVAAATGAADRAAAHLAEHRADRALWHAWLGIITPYTTPTHDHDQQERDQPDQHREDSDALVPVGAATTPTTTPPSRRTGEGTCGPGSIGRSPAPTRRMAPPWLVPPPRRTPTETDLTWPAEVLTAMGDLRRTHPDDDPILPPDVRAAITADIAAIIADEEHQAAERTAYEAELAALRAAATLTVPDPAPDPAPRPDPAAITAPAAVVTPTTTDASEPAAHPEAAHATPSPPLVAEAITERHHDEPAAAASRGAAQARRLPGGP